MRSVELFNCVLHSESSNKEVVVTEDGYVFFPGTLWAKNAVRSYFSSKELSPEQLNSGFYNSFSSSGDTLKRFVDQITHYISTYGTNFEGETFIPESVHCVPNQILKIRIIKSCTSKELEVKCMNILNSGMALKETTTNAILDLLEELGVKFEDGFSVSNREATIHIMDRYNIVPKDPAHVFRYVILEMTGSSLIVKNNKSFNLINKSDYNPGLLFERVGLEKMASLFNRYKSLFLSMKKKCPHIINRISKLSKRHHIPLASNPLNFVTSSKLKESDYHWLDNATIFALFKALNAVKTRIDGQTSFSYRIRNGKMHVANNVKTNVTICLHNYDIINNVIMKRLNVAGKKFYVPENVDYALPTSDKMFVGNIPVGTKIYGERMVVGIYWMNSWGSQDIDLSCISLNKDKVGWNASWSREGVTYSGDITNAPQGAVEYLHCASRSDKVNLVFANIYRGKSDDTKFKLLIGSGDDISRSYLMDPKNLLVEEMVTSSQTQTTLGLLTSKCFTIVNGGSGNRTISTDSTGLTALIENVEKQIRLKSFLSNLGAVFVSSPEEAEIDLSINKLTKNSFISIFS